MTRSGALAGLALCLAWAPHAAGSSATRIIHVAAAANLKYALDEAVTAYEAGNPGADIRVTYGASGAFFSQIQNGAPFDLFLSADEAFPRKLVESGHASAAAFTYAYGRLVVWVPTASNLDFEKKGLRALLDAAVQKIAIGNPAVAPYGTAARSALETAGLYEAVKGKLVLGQNVSQAAQFAQSSNAQAAFLPLSLAIVPPLSKEGRHWPVPPNTYAQIGQAGVILRSASDPELAKSFASFLLGPLGRSILLKYGYWLPQVK
jgi:molybdate transport system substrate-binding protein